MRFTDLDYLFFLAIAYAGSVLIRASGRAPWTWLLVLSLGFYAAWDVRFIGLLGAATLLDFAIGAALGRATDPGTRTRLVWLSIVGNLGMLAVFKYGDFALDSVAWAAGLAGAPLSLPRLGIALPIGISFYTFQTLSYSIDVYRGTMPAVRSLRDFAFFVAFFPQLVAGPIVRASDFVPQIERPPRTDAGAIGEGLFRIAVGMVKKIVLGDGIGRALVDPFFADPSGYNGAEALLADWAAYFALYCDFSGYTDIAIGSALLFGFVLPENFDRPAFAPSPLDHWRRWHITLGTFLRDYLYFPLGGARVSATRHWFNLFLTFFVSGVWHGVGASYVLMGLWNGLFAATWRLIRPAPSRRPIPRAVESLIAFQITALSVALLRPISLDTVGQVASAFLRWGAPAGGLWDATGVGLLGFVILLHLSPRAWRDHLYAAARGAPPFAAATMTVVVGGFCGLFAVWTRDFYYFQF